jgi:uncharacterized membrane protein
LNTGSSAEALRRIAVATLAALFGLVIAWELWLAPLRPGGSWLAIRALPLLAALPGIARGRRRTFQWAAMLALVYVADGAVRVWTEAGVSRTLAWVEIALAAAFFCASAFGARALRSAALPPG